MSAVKSTIDGLVEARHRLITDSALEMNRMSEYMSYLSCDCPNFKAIQNIMTCDFHFDFNNDNYIDTYMIDVSYTDNDLYQLIVSNYDLYLVLTKEIKKLKELMFESYLIFWDSFIANYSNKKNNDIANNDKFGKYILQKSDSLLIINGFIYRYDDPLTDIVIPTDIINLCDIFYKTFEFQKCNPLMNFELNDNDKYDKLKFNHKFIYNGVVIMGHLFKSFRRERFKLSLKIKNVTDTTFGIGFISPKYNMKLPIETGKNNHCMFLFGNGNYLSSQEFNVFCKRTKWNDDLSLFKSNDNDNNDHDIIITIEVNMALKTAKIYNKINKSIIWYIKLPETIAVAIYLNDQYEKKTHRIHSNSTKKVITIIDQQFNHDLI